MKRRLSDERGVSLVELMVAMAILAVISAAVVTAFLAGVRASADASARTADQGTIQTAVNRLEFELRCASGATVPHDDGTTANSSVHLTLPSECIHGTGDYTWCVSSGSLIRYSGSACSGTSQVFATGVTTATPFTLLDKTSGRLPQLQIILSVNQGANSTDADSITETITLRNDARTA
jgi:prepilin-type N-terminal cleavage/methylation domain-containing protein